MKTPRSTPNLESPARDHTLPNNVTKHYLPIHIFPLSQIALASFNISINSNIPAYFQNNKMS